MPVFNMLDFSNSSDSNSVNYWFEVFKILLSSWQLVFIIVIFLFKKQLTGDLQTGTGTTIMTSGFCSAMAKNH